MPKIKRGKNYPITLSDWLQYLEHISNFNLTMVFGMLSLAFITIVFIISYSNSQELNSLGLAITGLVYVVVSVLLIFFLLSKFILTPTFKEIKTAQILLEEILVERKEELQNPEAIAKEWKERTKTVRGKRKFF